MQTVVLIKHIKGRECIKYRNIDLLKIREKDTTTNRNVSTNRSIFYFLVERVHTLGSTTCSCSLKEMNQIFYILFASILFCVYVT